MGARDRSRACSAAVRLKAFLLSLIGSSMLRWGSRNWEAPEDDMPQEFRLTERLTFLEFLPVATTSLRKSSSSPELSSFAEIPLKLSGGHGVNGGNRMNRRDSSSTTCSVSSMEDLNSPPSKFGSQIAGFKSSSEGGTSPVDGCGRWSVGSALHSQGGCKPCTWFWRPGGCTRGEACQHCHQCPRGALKKQKRYNRIMLKAKREARGS
eukprot:Skav225164  [mRNA]  locus=scaffold1095:42205:42828:- [translate_table: standard]